jgi:hypothetical protein
MNFHDSDSDDNASDTSGGVPTDPEDDDMPVAPTLAAATVPSTSRAAHTVRTFSFIHSHLLIFSKSDRQTLSV